MELIEKTVKKNYVYKGKIFNVRRDDALLPNGKPCIREIVEHSGGVCILAVEDGFVYTVEQFRYPYGEVVVELPAGKKLAEEAPADCAARELKEETGLTAGKLTEIGYAYPSPGYAQEKIYIFVAENLSKGKEKLDEDEFLNVKKIKISELKEKIKTNEIKDAKTIIAVLYYLTYLCKE